MDDIDKFGRLQEKLQAFHKLIIEIQSLYIPLCCQDDDEFCQNENCVLKYIRNYIDNESTRVASLVQSYSNYEVSFKQLTSDFKTNIERDVETMNDSFKDLEKQLCSITDQFKLVGSYSKNIVEKIDNHLNPEFRYKNNVKYPVDIELISKYPQSVYYQALNDLDTNDDGEIYIDCEDTTRDLLIQYMKKDPIDYQSLNDEEKHQLAEDIEYFQLPFRLELSHLFNCDDENELPAWKMRYIKVNDKYYEYFNNYIRVNGMLDKWFKETFIHDLQYDCEMKCFYIAKNISSIDIIDHYVMQNSLDLDLIQKEGANSKTILEDFKYVGIDLTPSEIESITTVFALPLDNCQLVDSELLNTLKSWCGENKKWKLLYKGTKHGDSATTFHQFCDDKDETIVLVKAYNKDNYPCVFGGYTTRSWKEDIGCERNADFKFDNYSFIFTLQNPYQIPPTQLVLKNKKYAILCNNKYGPVFGDNDLFIADHFLSSSENCVHLGDTYCSPTYKSYSLFINTEDSDEYKHFKIDELEVYGL